MAYFYLFLQAFIFSFGGLLMKGVKTMLSPYMSSFFRFLIGIFLLLVIQLLRPSKGKISLKLTGRAIILGGIFKAMHYLGENYGVMNGFSYGGVLVWPVQTLTVLIFSAFVLKEKFTLRTLTGAILSVTGVLMVSWNGASPDIFFKSQAGILIAFIFAGIGASFFSFFQKEKLESMDMVELNASMFVYGLITTLFVLVPTGPHLVGDINPCGVFCMIMLGMITCFGFLLQAAALKSVSVLIATLIQSSTCILTIIWGVLIYGDPISLIAIIGTVLFLAGIVLVNLEKASKSKANNINKEE